MSENEFELLSTKPGETYPKRVSIGRSSDHVYRCEEDQPLIVFGPQRSGKTTSVVIPSVLEWDGPCLVTSVRFDVVAATLKRRRELGETFIFDPAGLAESSGERFADYCVGWSPLDSIQTWDDAARQSGSLSEGVDTNDVTNGGFWQSQARLLLTPLLFAAARTGATMGGVLSWLGMNAADLIDILMERRDRADSVATDDAAWNRCIERLMNYEGFAGSTYTSICATAQSMLEVFTFEEVDRRCATGRRLSLETLTDGGQHTLYMCAPAHEQRLFTPLFTALVRQVVHTVIERNGGSDDAGDPIFKVRLMLCLDEAGNIAKLDDLHQFATTAAGSGIQLISVFHDMSQLYAAYGPDRGGLIVNNHRGKLFLPGNSDPRTGDFLHDQLLDTDIRGRQEEHFGWRRADLRELKAETALCLYGGLPPTLVRLRRWREDEHLLRIAEGGVGEGGESAVRPRPERDVRHDSPATEPVRHSPSAANPDELEALKLFVPELVEQYDLSHSILPCWHKHRAVVDEMLALKKARDEIESWNDTTKRLDWPYWVRNGGFRIKELLRRCRAGHVDPVTSWVTEDYKNALEEQIRQGREAELGYPFDSLLPPSPSG